MHLILQYKRMYSVLTNQNYVDHNSDTFIHNLNDEVVFEQCVRCSMCVNVHLLW